MADDLSEEARAGPPCWTPSLTAEAMYRRRRITVLLPPAVLEDYGT